MRAHRPTLHPCFLAAALLSILLLSLSARADDRTAARFEKEDLRAEAPPVTLRFEAAKTVRTVEYALWFSALPLPEDGAAGDRDLTALYEARGKWEQRMRAEARRLIATHGPTEGATSLRPDPFVGSVGQRDAQAIRFKRTEHTMGSEILDGVKVHAYLLRRREATVDVVVQFAFDPDLSGDQRYVVLNPTVASVEAVDRPEGAEPLEWIKARRQAVEKAKEAADATREAMHAPVPIPQGDLNRIRTARGGRVAIHLAPAYPCGGETVHVAIRLGAFDPEPEPAEADEGSEPSPEDRPGLGPWPQRSAEALFTERRQRLVRALLLEARRRLDWLESEYTAIADEARPVMAHTSVRAGWEIELGGAREEIEAFRRIVSRRERLWSEPEAFQERAQRSFHHRRFETPHIERSTRSDLYMGLDSAMRRLWALRVDLRERQMRLALKPLWEKILENKKPYWDEVRAVKKKGAGHLQSVWRARSQREALMLADRSLRTAFHEKLVALQQESKEYLAVHTAWIRAVLPPPLTDHGRAWLADVGLDAYAGAIEDARKELRRYVGDFLQVWVVREPVQDATRHARIEDIRMSYFFPPNATEIPMPGDTPHYTTTLAVKGRRRLEPAERDLLNELLQDR